LDAIKSIHAKYCADGADGNAKSNARASMLTVYIEEAHAVDEWAVPVPRRTGGHIKFAKDIGDRIKAAKDFVKDNSYPGRLVCDHMDGDVAQMFDAWPERLYIIENDVVVYKGGMGPFHYEPSEVLNWLDERFKSQAGGLAPQ
jgi:hypothetical protein